METSELDDVAFLRAELERKRHEYRQLQDSFDEFTQSSQELEAELEAELARAERQQGQLSQRVAGLEDELAGLRTRLDKTLQEMRTCENDRTALQHELARITELKRALEQDNDELATRVRILTATEEDLRYKMEREMEEKVFLVSDQEELKHEHELVQERLRTEIVDLQSELVALQQRHRALVEAQAEAPITLPTVPEAPSSGGGSQEATDAYGVDSDGELVVLPPRLSTLEERDLSDREQLIETLQQELEVASLRLQEEVEARDRLENELMALQDSLAQAEAMENEMTEMTEELIEKSQEIRQRDLEIQSLEARIVALNAENTTLREEIDAARRVATAIDTPQNALLQDEVEALRQRCIELEATEHRLRDLLDQESNSTIAIRKENDDLARQLEESTELRRQLEQELDSQTRNRKLEFKELQDRNTALQRKLDSASQRAADLERATVLSTISSVSASSTSTSSSDGKAGGNVRKPKENGATSPVVQSLSSDSRRFLLEIQSLRATIHSLQAENSRLRHNEPNPLVPGKRMSTDVLKLNYSPDQLAKRYLAERTRNAALLSRLQTVCGNIQVFCRVRPVISEELEKAYGAQLGVNVINQSDVAALDVRPERVFVSGDDGNQPPDANTGDLMLDLVDANASWKVFTFDRVIGPSETQIDVFREVEPIAQSVVEGFKACIFAYGQTGSGKTHTMEGSESDPGLNYRVVHHIFQSIVLRGSMYDPHQMEEDDGSDAVQFAGAPSEPCYHIQVGVLEIYNETLRDLINPENANSLEIRQDVTSGDILVPDLTMSTVSDPEETIDLLRRAQSNRVTGKTDVHAHSSRSHCVVILQISTKMPSTSNQHSEGELLDSYVSGKLYLVDLAGSERVKKSNVSGAMLREAAHINKSLSALADVMEALDKKQSHVPYRNSKLTYLLQDVLNTSCKTVMIVNVGPTLESANETFRSLQLAERVRNIVVGRNSIVKNKKDLISAKRAYAEIQSLKQQMQISARKFKQSQQTVVALKRDQKNQSDQQLSMLQARAKAAETQANGLKTQADALKRQNEELTAQMKHEREAKLKEVEQREAAQRMLRQLNSKSRVNTSHQEALERQLRDREDEIKKLRQMLTEARQRTSTSVIPRRSVSNNVTPTKKKDKESEHLEPTDNQADENNDTSANRGPRSEGSSRRLSMPKFGLTRQNSSLAATKKPSSQRSEASVGNVSKLRRIGSSTSSTGPASVGRPTWK